MNDDKLDGRLVQGIPSNCLVVNRQVAESSNALPASLEEVPNTLPEAQKENSLRRPGPGTQLKSESTASREISTSAKKTEFDVIDHGDGIVTKLRALQLVSQQLASLDKVRIEQEAVALRLKERIQGAEIMHGTQLQQLSALQRAIERRRELLGNDREAYTKNRLAQQQVHERAEALRAAINRIATEIRVEHRRASEDACM